MKEKLQQVRGVKNVIQTVQGKALYIGTEIEDANGKWDDNYPISKGYYVVHEGKNHHIYKVIKEKYGSQPTQPLMEDEDKLVQESFY